MTCKAYDIPKSLVWEAWLHVRENQGAAGIYAETKHNSKKISKEERDQLKRANLARLREAVMPKASSTPNLREQVTEIVQNFDDDN